MGGIPVFQGKTGLEHRLERFVPVETKGSRHTLFNPKGKSAEKPIQREVSLLVDGSMPSNVVWAHRCILSSPKS